ncbi:MAG TPA: hypothetical protein VJ656_10670 [Pyrinomonadaceae bacterium]|nr:hypothetical protein [Pyrinomonadaceae bacterium]
MKKRRILRVTLLALCAAVCLMGGSFNVHAQEASTAQAPAKQPESNDDTNLDTQLFLIVGTNQDVADANLPASLDSVLKQLRATLPFKNYRLAATLLNRVKNEGRLDLKWIGGPLAPTAGAPPTLTPTFSNFTVHKVRLVRANDGQQKVQMQGFNFGARVPIQTGQAIASSDGRFPTGGFPTINYEPTGVATDISMREGEPVIVGTLNVGPSGDAIILVVSAKRTQK